MLVAERDAGHPFRADGWRSGATRPPILVELDETVPVDRARGRVGDHEVQQLLADHHLAVLTIDGRREQAVVNVQPHIVEAVHRGQRFVFERPDVFGDHALAVGDGAIRHRCPARCSTSGSPRASPSPRATCWARWRR